jgi:hypothetical protein
MKTRCGSALSISATTPTAVEAERRGDGQICDPRKLRRSAFCRAEDVEDRMWCMCPRPTRHTSAATTASSVIREYTDKIREPVPGGPQWNAQVQQPGPLHADGHDGGRKHHQWRDHKTTSGPSTPRWSTTKKSELCENKRRSFDSAGRKKTRPAPLLMNKILLWRSVRVEVRGVWLVCLGVCGGGSSAFAVPGRRRFHRKQSLW